MSSLVQDWEGKANEKRRQVEFDRIVDILCGLDAQVEEMEEGWRTGFGFTLGPIGTPGIDEANGAVRAYRDRERTIAGLKAEIARFEAVLESL